MPPLLPTSTQFRLEHLDSSAAHLHHLGQLLGDPRNTAFEPIRTLTPEQVPLLHEEILLRSRTLKTRYAFVFPSTSTDGAPAKPLALVGTHSLFRLQDSGLEVADLHIVIDRSEPGEPSGTAHEPPPSKLTATYAALLQTQLLSTLRAPPPGESHPPRRRRPIPVHAAVLPVHVSDPVVPAALHLLNVPHTEELHGKLRLLRFDRASVLSWASCVPHEPAPSTPAETADDSGGDAPDPFSTVPQTRPPARTLPPSRPERASSQMPARLEEMDLADAAQFELLGAQRRECGWYTEPSELEAWRAQVAGGSRRSYWIVTDAAGRVGHVSTERPAADSYKIAQLFVSSKVRGGGVAGQAMGILEEEARKIHEVKRVVLDTFDTAYFWHGWDYWTFGNWLREGMEGPRDGSLSAAAWYARRGYVVTGRVERYEGAMATGEVIRRWSVDMQLVL